MLPTIRIKDKEKKLKYDYEDWGGNVRLLSENDLRGFINDFLGEKLLPSFKS
jgi:protein disulfide-isomerase A1